MHAGLLGCANADVTPQGWRETGVSAFSLRERTLHNLALIACKKEPGIPQAEISFVLVLTKPNSMLWPSVVQNQSTNFHTKQGLGE